MLSAFEQLIYDNHNRLQFIAKRYSRSGSVSANTEDLYQEMVFQLWKSFDSFKGESSLSTWVYKVALNTAFTYLGKEQRRKEMSLEASTFASFETPSTYSEADILASFVAQLNDIDAGVLMMYLDGISSESIAQVLGVSSDAIRSRIKRIKAQYETMFIEEQL